MSKDSISKTTNTGNTKTKPAERTPFQSPVRNQPQIQKRGTLSRRNVLRGLGASIALPFMESLLPNTSARALADTIENKPKRLTVFFSPNGMSMGNYRPKEIGSDYQITPILKPLERMRDKFSIISNLAHYQASAFGDAPAGHGRSCPAMLTGVHVKQTEGADIQCGISMDQVAANHYASETQIASLELGIEPPSLLGSCDINYSCTYTNTLSWRNETVALPVVVNPHDVFERLFGDGNQIDEKTRQQQLNNRASILDFVREDASRLSANMGMNDKRKMDEYLDSIRDVERRIQKAKEQNIEINLDGFQLPVGMPTDFEEHVGIMLELQLLALQTDMTRVSSFMLGRELSNRSYGNIGVPDSHHTLSHHAKNPEKIAKLEKINAYHMKLFADYLERMNSIPDGDGSLLDNTFVIRSSCFGDSNDHDHMDLPVLLAGGGLEGNRHLVAEKDTPMCNLMLTVLQEMGVPVSEFGDSSKPFSPILDRTA